MIIQRDLLKQLTPFLKRKEFISIIGPRQTGKTTLLKLLKRYLCEEQNVIESSIKIITFEDRKLLFEFEKDAVTFIQSYLPPNRNKIFYLMIDEFQYAQDGGQKLKLIYDTMENIKIIITGSSSLDIKAKVGKFMIGRILTFTLYPFSFQEFLRFRDSRLENIHKQHNLNTIKWLFDDKPLTIKKGTDLFYPEFISQYEHYCIWGGYPAGVLTFKDMERKKLLNDIYNNYILKDIKNLLELRTEKKLYLLSQYLSTQIGQVTVYQNLGITAGLDHYALKKHLDILTETFICKEIKPFFQNKQKELSRNPKIFFLDMGFRNNLIDNTNSLEKRSDSGAIVENTVFIQLNRLCEGINKINFWRTKSGAEVDFLIHQGENIIPIEVKFAPFSSEKFSKSFLSFINSHQPRKSVILTKNYWGLTKKNKTEVLFIPAYYL